MHSSILKRTFRYFLISSFVIITAVAFLIFAYLQSQYQEQFTQAQLYVTGKTAETVNALRMDIKQSAYNLCVNETLAEALVEIDNPITQRQALNRVIVTNAATPTATRLQNTRQVLLVDGQFSFAHAPDTEFTLDIFPNVHVYSSLDVVEEEWYQTAREYNAQIYAFCHPEKPDTVFFAHLLRSIHLADPRYNAEIGVMLYAMPRSVLSELLLDDQMSEGSVSLLLYHDMLMGSTDEALFPTGGVAPESILNVCSLKNNEIAPLKVNGRRYSVASRAIGSDWRVVLLTPSSNAWQALGGMLPLISLAGLALAVAALLISIMFSRRLSAPILNLSNSMARYRDANALPQPIPVPKSDDEIERLYHSYNDIVDNIHRISALERERNAQLQKTELKALQSQINPHFIYNTLDSIACIALINGEDDIATMVASLINILKYSLRFSHIGATLKEEIDYLSQYIQIQKLRYSDRFRFECDVPEEYMDVRVPRLMLQPLVENALFHAQNAEQLVIRVWCTQDEDGLCIHVSDNGTGANPDQLNSTLTAETEATEQKFGIGIRNVNKRIRILMGEGYGIRYRLTPEGGLDAVITVQNNVRK